MNALKLQAFVARRPMVNSTPMLRRAAPLWRRSYSSAIPDTLPLAGFKVLDMTRVLAGVSEGLLFLSQWLDMLISLYSHIVHRYWEI